jgi:hypothetical protein
VKVNAALRRAAFMVKRMGGNQKRRAVEEVRSTLRNEYGEI